MKCKFKDGGWECPLQALPGEDYCYWHKKEDGKEPDNDKLKELKYNDIRFVYLKKANLSGKDLSYANLENANLEDANLARANFKFANLRVADFSMANLQEADFRHANLQGAIFINANLQNTNFYKANLQGANLWWANLKGADLRYANLQGSNLYNTIIDSGTRLEGANLTHANLYLSYIDNTKTLRYAKFEDERDINEIIADLLNGKKSLVVLDVGKIENIDKKYGFKVSLKLRKMGLVRYVPSKEDRDDVATFKDIIIYDREKGEVIVKIPYGIRRFLKKGDYRGYKIKEIKDLIDKYGIEEILYDGSKKELYEASYEVYSKLYNFFIQNGMIDKALAMHYRRGEVNRKLLNEMGGLNRLRSWLYDFLILKVLTGYGVKLLRPLIVGLFIILIFAFLFWLTDGIIKEVNGTFIQPDFWDYLYFSVTTFTTLGYSNIQPNLTSGHIPQLLVALESFLGILIMSLFIFVITYRVSR